jgi:hypothetical protein
MLKHFFLICLTIIFCGQISAQGNFSTGQLEIKVSDEINDNAKFENFLGVTFINNHPRPMKTIQFENRSVECFVIVIDDSEINTNYELSVSSHPNFSDCLFFETDYPGMILFRIISNNGRIVKSDFVFDNKINPRDLPDGHYTLELQTTDFSFFHHIKI